MTGADPTYDVAVVGGGSAGCVVASRLSENPDCSVVLIEAGPYFPTPEETPDPVRDASNLFPGPEYDWGYVAVRSSARASRTSQPLVLWRGKLMGGSSAVNGAGALRALPSDFDRWAESGLGHWSYDTVLPYFRRLETDAAPDDRFHGRHGPMHIVRFGPDELTPSHAAFIESCRAAAHPFVADHNVPGAIGVGPLPMNCPGGLRLNTALAYLSEARDRPNFTALAQAMVDRLAIGDHGVHGVVLADGSMVRARRVVLSAGSLSSPCILMRSGIGPAEHLAERGIPVVLDRPGVGQHLQDHPAPVVAYATNPDAVGARSPAVQTVLTLASGGSLDQADIDLNISVTPFVEGQLLFFVGLVKPVSLGSVTLASKDPAFDPVIDPNFYDRDEDLARLVAGMRAVRRIVGDGPLRTMVASELTPGASVSDEEALADALVQAPASYQHASCTCRMGLPDDPAAVVDQWGGVIGMDDVWVMDASIFPTIPSAPTNITTIMAAERCAHSFPGR